MYNTATRHFGYDIDGLGTNSEFSVPMVIGTNSGEIIYILK